MGNNAPSVRGSVTKVEKSASEIWRRVVACEGTTFRQIRGGEFSYEVRGDRLILDRTNQFISKDQLFQAVQLVPLSSTKPVQHLRAPSYLFAILMDERVRQGDW